MAFVIDASAILAAFFSELPRDRTDRLLDRFPGNVALVPAIFPFEVANGLEMARRRGRFDHREIDAFAADLADLPFSVGQPPDMADMAALRTRAERDSLTVYDAAYLALAEVEGLELITLDGALARAARASGVKVISP